MLVTTVSWLRALAAALLLGLGLTSAQAASISLQKTGNTLTATIAPDSSEVGQSSNVWIAAAFNGNIYVRGSSTQKWTLYTGGALPVAQTLNLAATQQLTLVDFDISSLVGLDLYLAYGRSEADWQSKSDHLVKLYTVTSGAGSSGSVSSGGVAAGTASSSTSYAGTYVGTYTGLASGTLSLTVDSNNLISVTAPSAGSGSVASSGSAGMTGTLLSTSCIIYGTFTTAGKASGTWSCVDAEDGSNYAGSWSATRQSSTSTGGSTFKGIAPQITALIVPIPAYGVNDYGLAIDGEAVGCQYYFKSGPLTTPTGTLINRVGNFCSQDNPATYVSKLLDILHTVIGNLWQGSTVPSSDVIKKVVSGILNSESNLTTIQEELIDRFVQLGYVAAAGKGSAVAGVPTAGCSQAYSGPTYDPQFYTFCQLAYAYSCQKNTTAQTSTCKLLDSYVRATSTTGETAASYCPAYCK